MDQKRFILAVVISLAILLGWSYLFPSKPTPQNNSNNSANQQQATASPTPASQATPSSTPEQTQAGNVATEQEPAVPRRKLSIKTPLYEVELDNQGAIATSWILKKIKKSGGERDIYSVAGTKDNRQPLQLIPQGELFNKGQRTLLLVTGDQKIDETLASKTYEVSVPGIDASDVITLSSDGSKEQRVDFTIKDSATGIKLTKSFIFYSDRYGAAVEVKTAPDSAALPQPKLTIGPSIGDQGVPHYSFYSVAPEGVAGVGDKTERLYGASIHENKESPDRQAVNGAVSWAAVGDTYFAMAAVLPQPVQGVEYRTAPYEHQAGSNKETRYLISGLVPVSADGSRVQLYVGPKDHEILANASKMVQGTVGRPVDLEGLINYGWLSFISRPLAVPILWSIDKLYRLTSSYGVAIILFTIVIYSLFFPLKWRSSKAMKKAQKYAPRMKELQEKLKGMKQNDPRMKELQVEQLRLMKEANPLGGCLPLLIQMPFLFALYCAITVSIDFRQASFLWMPDLSTGDPLHLLEILMAGSMVVLQLITPAPSADPLQRKMMAFGMPLFMLYILWGAPAGLLIYWLVGNIVGFSQQFLINYLTKSEDDEQPPAEKNSDTRSTKKLRPARAS
jgi:YidC/Oxa1 family membrane protein insertase